MRRNYPKYILILPVLLLVIWTISCSGRPEKAKPASKSGSEAAAAEVFVKYFKLISPADNEVLKLNTTVKLILAPENKNKLPDSIQVYFDGKAVKTFKEQPWEYSIPGSFSSLTGRKPLKITSFKEGKSQNTITKFYTIYSDVAPAKNGYKIVKTYPHSRDAFTQGLVYDKGVFFEGTGQETESSLREVEPETGKVKRQLNIEASLFGEGIALYKDRIYQVTWQNKVGFVYEKATFKQLNKIHYSTQGWGMTTINDKIVLSDGTNILYFYDPESFTVTSRIEVYDNLQRVDSLNELEYINGEIWANIWLNDNIVRIDPSSGKVIGYINMKGILPESERKGDTDCLNGIAYDPDGKRIFVTGKKWPKLYEIKITE